MNSVKEFSLSSLDFIFATREIARFAVEKTLAKKCKIISLKNIKSTSRSFLDELYILSKKNKITLIDIPNDIEPLFALVIKTHLNQKMYAPTIKVRISKAVFA